jgi:hypothetical protein
VRNNDATYVRRLLKSFAQNDDLTLTWRSEQQETPFDDGRPAELEVQTSDGVPLGRINSIKDGFDTVLEALSTSKKAYNEMWKYNYHPSQIRVRWSGDKFVIQNIK